MLFQKNMLRANPKSRIAALEKMPGSEGNYITMVIQYAIVSTAMLFEPVTARHAVAGTLQRMQILG